MSARSRFLPPPLVKPVVTPKYPWLVPAAATLAGIVLVGGIVWAALLGKLF